MDDGIVVTALDARTNFDKLLRRVEDEGRSVVIEKRGRPRAVLLSVRDYVRLAVPEPEVLRIIGPAGPGFTVRLSRRPYSTYCYRNYCHRYIRLSVFDFRPSKRSASNFPHRH
jgi:prevent-host-death family protein